MQVEYLQSLHIEAGNVCNMMTIAPRALSLDVDSTLKPVIDYIQAQGVTGANPVAGAFSSSLPASAHAAGWLLALLQMPMLKPCVLVSSVKHTLPLMIGIGRASLPDP